MADKTPSKLPRVHLTFDVDRDGANERKALPFVAGVIADLSGKAEKPQKVKVRKFVEIDRDNFNDVMASINPRLGYRVDNKIEDNGTKLQVDLSFSSMDDFRPESVAKNVKPLERLLNIRKRLTDLLTKMDGNDTLVERLGDIIKDTEKLTAMAKPKKDDSEPAE